MTYSQDPGHEERIAATLDAALDCIVTIDHTGSILEFNAAAEETFGYRRADGIGRKIVDLLVPVALRQAHRADGNAGRRHRVPGRARNHAHPGS